MAKKTTKKVDKKQELAKELKGLIKNIDEEGLFFLIKQANTLIYNQKVDELNKQAESLSKTRSKTSKKNSLTKKNGSKKKQITEESGVSIERGAFGSSFIVQLGSVRKTFGEEELLRLVKVCHAGKGIKDSSARAYRWLSRYRDDVLIDSGIGNPRSALLSSFSKSLVKNFKIKK